MQASRAEHAPEQSPDLSRPVVGSTGGTVLFVAEAVTLAHVARPVALARALAARGFDPVVAVDPRYADICPVTGARMEPLRSIPSAQFLEALARGAPLYDLPTLRQYVEDDLALLRRVRPAVVVGDFRLSLSVSARLLGVPYINLSNAYWSPRARPVWHVPDLPWSGWLPPALGDMLFRTARPLAFRLHARAMEALRREHALPSLGSDLRRVYTDGDLTLYADPAELVPLIGAPSTERHLGPVPWSPEVALPAWWPQVAQAGELVYVTLGSSGSGRRLPDVVEGLSRLGVTVVVATAGATLPATLPANVYAAPFLPGDALARLSSLVVCNGGSPSSHQALAHGVPVLGLPGNLDQFLNMGFLERAGVGAWLRPQSAGAQHVERLARHMLGNRSLHTNAVVLARAIARYDPAALLVAAIEDLRPGLRDASKTPGPQREH